MAAIFQARSTFAFLVSLILILQTISVWGNREEAEERLRGDSNPDDNNDENDLSFRSEDLPTACWNWYMSVNSQLPKRNFNPWGGKRSSSWDFSRPMGDVLIKKGTGFNPWGGKRAYEIGSSSSRVTKNDKSRSAFNPWGGRR